MGAFATLDSEREMLRVRSCVSALRPIETCCVSNTTATVDNRHPAVRARRQQQSLLSSALEEQFRNVRCYALHLMLLLLLLHTHKTCKYFRRRRQRVRSARVRSSIWVNGIGKARSKIAPVREAL